MESRDSQAGVVVGLAVSAAPVPEPHWRERETQVTELVTVLGGVSLHLSPVILDDRVIQER